MGGKSSDPNKAAMKAQKEQRKRLDNIERREMEEYILQSPELVGQLEAQGLGPSELADLSIDQDLRGNQLAVLEQLKKVSQEGYTQQDKAELDAMLSDVAAKEMSNRGAINQEMARKGMADSGSALMQKLLGSQNAANQGREQANRMSSEANNRKMQALQNLGQQSSHMQQQDFNRGAMQAQAADQIARANAMNRQQVSGQNLAARQAIANQKVNTANQQSAMKNQIAQQNFANDMAIATGHGNVANSMSSIAASGPQKPGMLQAGLSGAATGAAASGGNPYGAMVGAGVGMLSAAEDGGLAYQDGGVAGYQDGGVPTTQQIVDKQALAEQKQHEKFKKDYMKRVRDELTPQKEAAEETTGVRVHAEDGAVASYGNGGKFDKWFGQNIKGNEGKTLPYYDEELGRERDVLMKTAEDSSRQPMRHENIQLRDSLGSAEDNPFYSANAMQQDAKKLVAGEKVDNMALIGQGNDKTSAEIQTNAQAQEVMGKDSGGMGGAGLTKGLGALSKMLGGGKQEKAEPLNLSYNAPEVKNIMQGYQPQQFSNPFAAEDGGISPYDEYEMGDLSKVAHKRYLEKPNNKQSDYLLEAHRIAKKDKEELDIPEGMMLNPIYDKEEYYRNIAEDVDKKETMLQKLKGMIEGSGEELEDGGVPYNHVPKAADGDYLLEDGVIDVGEGEYAGDRIDAKVNEGEMIINLPQQQRLMDLLRGEISVDELGDDDIVEGVPREFRDEMHEEGEEDIKGFRKLLQMLGEE